MEVKMDDLYVKNSAFQLVNHNRSEQKSAEQSE